MPSSPYIQPTLAEAGTPLRQVTFAVLDLETTGQPPDGTGITEIGVVKVRGGEQVGEFATLVNPGCPIPPLITVLTGITETMVAPAPRMEQVLPTLLEFLHGAVLVAHNAPFDTGHLKAACQRYGYRWPSPPVLDTAALARRVLIRDEVPNHQLATLARYFHTQASPTHRALDDARATVEVLHALIGRLGSFQVFTLEETIEFAKAISPQQRAKRHLAHGLPDAPGVYLFRDANDRVLYVGTSGSIATRVRSYFTASETRKRISEMLHAAQRVEAVVCAHRLEAEVRELRLISAHKPPYNRRSKFPERTVWLKLTAEVYPRLSFVGRVKDDGGTYLGPFSSRHQAELAATAIYDALPMRRCATRLSARRPSPACALAELGRCAAPCELRIDPREYDRCVAEPFRQVVEGDPGPVVTPLLAKMQRLAAAQRYEDAARVKGRLTALLRAAVRTQRLASLTRLAEVVAARREPRGGWELAVIRYGRLVAAGVSDPHVHPRTTLAALFATAETVHPGPGPTPCASAEETERVLAWLERPDVRLVECSGSWVYPAAGAARYAWLLDRSSEVPERVGSAVPSVSAPQASPEVSPASAPQASPEVARRLGDRTPVAVTP
ncbi:MAG: DEDD exonuclease domain-containing protein [Micromonosporaceae bacterium]|nr:DEDD exonuclease domain-containing protein [Micromonosporaceae bacterium]